MWDACSKKTHLKQLHFYFNNGSKIFPNPLRAKQKPSTFLTRPAAKPVTSLAPLPNQCPKNRSVWHLRPRVKTEQSYLLDHSLWSHLFPETIPSMLTPQRQWKYNIGSFISLPQLFQTVGCLFLTFYLLTHRLHKAFCLSSSIGTK